MMRDKAPQVSGSVRIESSGREYAKHKKVTPEEVKGFNVSYGDTYEPTDLADVKALGEGKAPKSWKSDRKAGSIKGFK
jgi:hypothetical protein